MTALEGQQLGKRRKGTGRGTAIYDLTDDDRDALYTLRTRHLMKEYGLTPAQANDLPAELINRWLEADSAETAIAKKARAETRRGSGPDADD